MNRGRAETAAVFLDRDGALIREDDYPLLRPEQVKLLPGAAAAVRRLNNAGLAAVVVSNQAIVARGLITLEGLEAVNSRMAQLLAAEAGARLEGLYCCPHHPNPPEASRVEAYCIQCDCRKPAPGLLLRAARELELDLGRSVMIGDSTRDIVTGQRAGCRTVLLTGVGHRGEDGRFDVGPDWRAANLPEAVDWLLRQEWM